MLGRLRKLSDKAKRALAAAVAGVIAIVILCAWLAYSFGWISEVFVKAGEQSKSAFMFLDQNVELAYNAFTDAKDLVFGARQGPALPASEATSTASTTVVGTASSTNETNGQER